VRSFAVELANENVQVNAVCPGWVNTEMARAGLADMARDMHVEFEEARRIAMQAVRCAHERAEDVAGWSRG
jgi:3-oxoacyl-[acyl-carrier protein] reductase